MNRLLRILAGGLLFFIVFAFAGAEPWAFSVWQVGILGVASFLLYHQRGVTVSVLLKTVLGTLAFLTGFCVLQASFPTTLLSDVPWFPSSLMPLFTWEHISLFITYAAVAAAASQLAGRSDTLKQFSLVIGLCGLAVVVCAVCLPDGEYIRLLTGTRGGGIGPFLNRNHAGVFIAMSAVVWLGYLSASFWDYAQFVGEHRKNQFFLRQFFFILVFISLVVGAVFTRSRGGMLALFTGVFSYAFLGTGFVPDGWKKRLKGLVITLLSLALCSGWIATHTQEINAFARRQSGTSAETRKMLYRAAWNLLEERPLWGIGVGAMPVAITPYLERQIPSYVERLHSDWLELLLGLGFGGFLPVAAGIVCFIMLALRRMARLGRRKKLTFAALLASLSVMSAGSAVDFDLFIPATGGLFFFVLGMACSPSYDKEHTRFCALPLPVVCGFVLLFAASCYLPVQKTMAWRLHLFGKGLLPHRQTAVYAEALAHYPAPRYALYLGNAYLKQSRSADPAQRAVLRAKAHQVALTYLEKYPKEKELSRLYMRTIPQD